MLQNPPTITRAESGCGTQKRKARRFIDGCAWYWTGGTHERKSQAATTSHPIMGQPHTGP